MMLFVGVARMREGRGSAGRFASGMSGGQMELGKGGIAWVIG